MASELEQACEKHKITLDVWPSSKPPMSKGMRSWFFVLHFEGRHMSGDFFTGSGIKGKPTAADVLYCVLSDASSYRNAPTLDAFAEDWWGDQKNSIKLLIECFEACKRHESDIRFLFEGHSRALEECEDSEH